MKVTQLSVFLENKPGQISRPCRALAKAEINILTLSLADTQQFGILRLIVRDWRKAKTVLEQAGSSSTSPKWWRSKWRTGPAGWRRSWSDRARRDQHRVHVRLHVRGNQKAVLVFRFDDPDKALELLRLNNVNVLGTVDL